jgi:hypothetical protein
MAKLIARYGLDKALEGKVLAVAMLAILFAVVRIPLAPSVPLWGLCALNALYVWVVVHNWRLLRA